MRLLENETFLLSQVHHPFTLLPKFEIPAEIICQLPSDDRKIPYTEETESHGICGKGSNTKKGADSVKSIAN